MAWTLMEMKLSTGKLLAILGVKEPGKKSGE
jgi:hypothetical protein